MRDRERNRKKEGEKKVFPFFPSILKSLNPFHSIKEEIKRRRKERRRERRNSSHHGFVWQGITDSITISDFAQSVIDFG